MVYFAKIVHGKPSILGMKYHVLFSFNFFALIFDVKIDINGT